jgi:hypothetical protein
MRKTAFQIFIAGMIASLCLSIIPLGNFNSNVVEAAVSNWQQGVSITSRWDTDFQSATFQQAVQNAAATGANYITLIIPYCQNDNSSSDIFNCANTPTDAAIRSAVNYVHSQGVKVMLKMHLESYYGGWRAFINSSNRDAWFSNYGAKLNNLATIGQETGAEGLTIGAELISMATRTSNPDNTARWQSMISQVRSRYSGFLTYSANWGSGSFAEEFPNIGFWPQLDYIGISGYFPLATDQGNPSVQALNASWAGVRDSKIKPLNTQYGKPILFTEIGYKSVPGAHYEPWNYDRGGYDGEEQRKLYESLMSFWNNESYMYGVHLWEWQSDPQYGGEGNSDYTPHNKPAENVLKQWWGGAGEPTPPPTSTTTPPATTTPPGGNTGGETTVPSNTTFSITASVAPLSPNSGQSSTINAQVSANAAVSNALIDIEVYDSAGTKVHQQFFEGRNLSSTPVTLSVPWTPASNGNYTVKGGIFNQNWSTNYYWNDSILPITVGSPTTPPPTSTSTPTTTPPTTPTSSYTTNVWWPTDGTSVNGLQPLKYNVDGLDASQYTGYWQVDGDRLNEMQTSTVDYPHKETLVDFTGWNWKGEGPYVINFVSKNSSGATISSKAVNLFVR